MLVVLEAILLYATGIKLGRKRKSRTAHGKKMFCTKILQTAQYCKIGLTPLNAATSAFYTNTQEFSANNMSTNLFCVSIQSRFFALLYLFQNLSLLVSVFAFSKALSVRSS